MKKHAFRLLAFFTLTTVSGFSQAINVTPTGVDIGAANSTTIGSLLQQAGQNTTFWSKDGVNAPSLLLRIQGDGKVGVGTATPQEKLDVAGNLKVNSAVLAPEGSAPMFAARAWVNFNGDGANSADQVIRASGNVTRVYKNSTGLYTIYFTTAMPDANFCVAGSTSRDGAGSRMVDFAASTSSTVQIEVRSGGGSYADSQYVHVIIFR